MESLEETKFNTGLIISNYNSDDIDPLLPLLGAEFPDWSVNKIKSYIRLVIKNKQDVAGILVAKNEAFYNVGLLIYTFQQIPTEKLSKGENTEFTNCLVVENIVSSSPILQKMVFLLMVESSMHIAKKNSCDFIELPKLDTSFELIKEKYNSSLSGMNGWRTFLKIPKTQVAS